MRECPYEFIINELAATLLIVPGGHTLLHGETVDGLRSRLRRLQMGARSVLLKLRLTPHLGDEHGMLAYHLVDRVTQNWLKNLTPERLDPDPLGRTKEQQQADLDEFVKAGFQVGPYNLELRTFGYADMKPYPRGNSNVVLHLHKVAVRSLHWWLIKSEVGRSGACGW